METPNRNATSSFWRSRVGLVLLVFVAATGLLMIYEHRAHVLSGDGLLVVLLVACLGSHFFLHGGHGDHDDPGGASKGSGAS